VLQVGELVEAQHGLIGLCLIVLELHLNLSAADATLPVRGVNRELHSTHFSRTDQRSWTGKRQDASEFDRFSVRRNSSKQHTGQRYSEADMSVTHCQQLPFPGRFGSS
jgi:hypothetical protein